ncbi:MAG TPA: fused MFS/spermidine synthase [Ideonella sp.]|nr:fused MFS/spermidine synthase [Ideonella sp.]HSI48779.1 fused MFS/spermidine synthase [Ideonella sp.]
MPDSTDSHEHVKPFVYETPEGKALHFTISEIQSRMQTQRPDALDLDYTRTMMAVLLFNSAPENLAMIGLGGGSLAKFCHRHLPNTRIKVVEINPHVIALRDEFGIPPDDDRFKVRRGDGAAYVRAAPYRVDVLMVDGFDNEGQPPDLCSQRFYDDCHDALQPDGILVVNLHAWNEGYEVCIDRINRSFRNEVLVVDARNCSNGIVFACKGALLPRFNPSALRKRVQFDQQTWDELKPAFSKVESALMKQFKGLAPEDQGHC